jgi:hypothetical protein
MLQELVLACFSTQHDWMLSILYKFYDYIKTRIDLIKLRTVFEFELVKRCRVKPMTGMCLLISSSSSSSSSSTFNVRVSALYVEPLLKCGFIY